MDAYKKIYYCVFKCFCGCVFIVSPRPKPLLRPFAEVLMKVVLKPRLHFLRMQWCTAHHHWTLAVEVCSVLVWLCCVRCELWWRRDCVSGVGRSPETIVTGPHMSVSFCRVKFLIRQRIRVLFPTLGGPTTTITIGGGSRGVRSTTGTWCFLVFMSWALFEEQTKINTNTVWRHELDSSYYVMHNTDLWKVLAMRTADWTANALGLRLRSSSSVEPFCFFSFFFSAFGPLCFCWCCFCFLTFPSILSTTHTAPYVHSLTGICGQRTGSTQFIGMDRRHQLDKKKELIWKLATFWFDFSVIWHVCTTLLLFHDT